MGDEQRSPLIAPSTAAFHSPAPLEALSRALSASPVRILVALLLGSLLFAVCLFLLLCASSSSPSLLPSTASDATIPLDSILGHDDRTSAFIVKLNGSSGEWLPYEGMTVIMRVINRSLPIYASLQSQLAAVPSVSALTTASLHVTLSSLLPRAKVHSLAAYNDLIRLYHPRFERLKAAYARLPSQPLAFLPTDLQQGTAGLSFTLHPKTERDRDVLAGYEELTREVLGSAFVSNARYHVGVAYRRLERVQDAAEWEEFVQRLTRQFAGTEVVVGPPELCRSIDMTHFQTL